MLVLKLDNFVQNLFQIIWLISSGLKSISFFGPVECQNPTLFNTYLLLDRFMAKITETTQIITGPDHFFFHSQILFSSMLVEF